MLKQYIGKNRAENLEWLSNMWLKDGPPVCFLQGFSGVGKTDLARDLRELAEKQGKWQQAVINEIADRTTPSVIESLMELSATLSRQGLPEMEAILFGESNPNLAYALEKALQRPVLIILDEAQRFFEAAGGGPLPEMNGILSFLRNRPDLQGRLLLLSDRVVETAKWSEWIPKRTLTKLEPQEAIEALEIKLKESGLELNETFERKQDVLKSLDYNPRAIEALVGALAYDSLDEIIGSKPGLWDTGDRVVSREFLHALERDLLERTLKHLDMAYQKKLWRLAVHRRSFKREALEKICANKDEAAQLRTILVTRYLINFRSGSLSLNPIVREISLDHLKEDPADCKQAHSGAADYYLRHFKAKQIVGSQTTLGESFAEARYHLVQAKREKEIREIGHRFTDHLKREISAVSSVPANAEELDERIGVLAVLVEDGGARGLEEHLARCLHSRRQPGDVQKALVHAERATGPHSSEASWYLLANLKHETAGVDAAVATIRNALRSLADKSVTQPLYQLGAEILSGANKTDEAVALLKDGIKVIPPDKALGSLYQSCADLLAKVGKTDEAVALLKEGIKVIPPDKNLFALYAASAELLANSGQELSAITLLREALAVIPPDKGASILYTFCANLMVANNQECEALRLLKEGIKVIPPDKNLFSLYQSCADLLAKVGKTDEAVALLKEGIKVIPPDLGLSALFERMSEVLCRAGRISDAIASQREGMKRIPAGRGGYRLAEAALLLAVGSEDTVQFREVTSELATKAMKHQELLSEVLGYEASGDWSQAQKAAAKARIQVPSYFALGHHEALCHLAQGDSEGALLSLPVFPSESVKQGQTQWWLAAFVHLRRGARPEASAALESYLGRPVDETRELNESFLLRLWDQQEITPEGGRLCFHFPIMPASLTGLSRAVRRVPFGKPVLPVQSAAANASGVVGSPSAVSGEPDVYVSYAWGDDKTPEGIKREEVVNQMCAAVGRTGRVVGRDKTVMKPGDSIDAFADKIAKAPRIVAVISEKSLHSKFCMVDEIYSAYQRTGFRRVEFQSKVIALVMDDAAALLKDDIALVTHWKAVHKQEHDGLKAVDPHNKALERWGKVHKLGDMCDHLLDMLDALKDIIMPRGYENIVKGNFDEVINRLPSAST